MVIQWRLGGENWRELVENAQKFTGVWEEDEDSTTYLGHSMDAPPLSCRASWQGISPHPHTHRKEADEEA